MIELVAIHCICVAAYALYLLRFQRLAAGRLAAELALALLLPVFGLALLLVGRISAALPKRDIPALYAGFKKRRRFAMRQQDGDIIPIHDALLFEDAQTRRSVLTRVIKQNTLSNRSALLDAVRDEDTEIAHYAVSILTHRLDELEMRLNRLRRKLQTTPDDPALLENGAALLRTYLDNATLDPATLRSRQNEYAAILESLIRINGHEKNHWIERIKLALNTHDLANARKYGLRFFKRFPRVEEPYLLYMQYCHLTAKYPQLQRTLQRLKSSGIPFSPSALETVRFWDQGGRYAS